MANTPYVTLHILQYSTDNASKMGGVEWVGKNLPSREASRKEACIAMLKCLNV